MLVGVAHNALQLVGQNRMLLSHIGGLVGLFRFHKF